MKLSLLVFRARLAVRRLLRPGLCRYCDGPLDAEDIRDILMCDRCCREGRDVTG